MLVAQMRNGGRRAAHLHKATAGAETPIATLCMQACVVLQEASRVPTWRGSSKLRLLPRLPLWEKIFTFLAPDDETDLHNTMGLVVERVAEYLELQHQLVSGAVLARAWHWLGRARYDNDAHAKYLALERKSHLALQEELERRKIKEEERKRWNMQNELGGPKCEEEVIEIAAPQTLESDEYEQPGDGLQRSYHGGPLAKAVQHLTEMQMLLKSRADDCIAAGRAFLAVCRPKCAAEALAEAAEAAQLMAFPELGEHHAIIGEELLQHDSAVGVAARAARVLAQEYALQAAHCWLLVAGSAGGLQEEALEQAGQQLGSAGRRWEAALCAARCGRPKVALGYLVGTDDDEKEVVLRELCAVLLCEPYS
eukprot:gnl/MRDRNA2_/MRDRNA2_151174_c0_seq1.p1 gnl/MRDRNA2_/MRDRNA2_151174_c0~~gnl/MRDRNA2_/MRDRNA2_151174_c0_seq1.p1  ORF type:complete len:377 (-),score=88.17 gnl/MRDRNA2_/MRDRNA2_151174_c0_seq1:22-1122(-)